MKTGHVNWWIRFAALSLAALLVSAGCSEQPVDVRGERDVVGVEDTDAMFQDILGFLDSYASGGLAAATDPTLIILGPSNNGSFEYVEPATSVDFVMMVENWDYPDTGRTMNCYIDGGALASPQWSVDGFTDDLEYTFSDVPRGMHKLCCVLAEGGVELDNCEATACVNLVLWQLCDYLSDPICGDFNPVSVEACLYDSQLDHRKCSYGPVDIDGICLSKFNCDCSDGVGFELCINNNCVPCAVDEDCDDSEPCTVDSCVFDGADSVCVNEWSQVDGAKCCSSTATEAQICADGLYCTTDTCAEIDPVSGVGHCDNVYVGWPCCDNHAMCADDDPCTVNACQANECRQGPKDDPLCCDPANGNADCEKGDPCVHSICLEETDQCQWTALTYQEQVDAGIACCDTHPDCQDGGLWEESPQDDPSTLDFCQGGQCVHVTNLSYCECNEGEGCPYVCVDDGVECTTDICNLSSNTCIHAPIPLCCEDDSWCDDGDLCTNDACVNGACEYVDVPESEGCCNIHADCEDGNPCNIDACLSHHCHYGPDPAQPNCCIIDANCEDYNDCTTETCHTDIHECLMEITDPPPQGKECCLTAAQCDDQNAATQDACVKHQCYHFQVTCVEGDLCNDYQDCTTDSCNTDTGNCDNVWIDNCCSSDVACNLPPLMPDIPENYCKEGYCSLATHTCVFEDITECCYENVDCDDGNYCTGDYCVNKKCKHVAVSNCCVTAADCDDDNACTVDTCEGSPGQCTFVADPSKPGTCCDSNGACADSDPCTDDYCLDHYCYHNNIENCCDEFTEAELCPDTNPCTCDLCIWGVCRHLPPDQAVNYADCNIPLTCCTADSDCLSDGNPCTVDACINNLCSYTLLDPCTLGLPYFQTFDNCNNVQADQGWLIENGFSFVDLGTNPAMGNWQCSTEDALGPDKHQRFNWAPTKADFDTYLSTPALDCVGHDYVTVMYRHELEYYDDVTPKTDIDLGLYLIDDIGGGVGPDALDAYHEIEGDSYQVDVAANWTYATVPATTGLLKQETFFAWEVGGETSYAMNHFDLDDVRVCPGRPPVFNNNPTGKVTVAMRMDEVGLFYFDVEDLDVTGSQDLIFKIVDGPSWVDAYFSIWNPLTKKYKARVRAKPANDITKLGSHTFTLRALDNSNDGCLFADLEITLWILVNDGYVVWDPVDEEGNHSDSFASTIATSIAANERKVQVLEDITLFDDLVGIRGVFMTLGVQGLDYVLTDLPGADANAIDLISDYLASGGRVYMEGGNTWGFDAPTDLHSQYYFPLNATAGEPAKYGETFPPGEVEGKHFCWGEDFSVVDSAILSFAVDTLVKKVGSSAIPILSDATMDHEVAISYESATFGCRTIAASLPFAALEEADGTFNSLMAKYIDFFENGYPSCVYNEQCFDSEVCTVDTCADGACQNVNEPDCIPCEDDLPCTASLPSKACAVVSGICGTLPGTDYDDTDGTQTITYGTPVTSTITVAGTDLVQQVNAKLYISHNYRGDLEIQLSHGGHDNIVLKAKDPTDNGKHFYFTYDFGLDANEMDVFLDEGENGDWDLKIIDHGVPFDGALLGWTLFVASGVPPCTVDGDCDDGNACTVDSCESGFCAFNADPCDDVNACVYFDSCDPTGVGCIYGDVNCDDSFVCTVDSCDPVTGCANVLIQHCTNICTSHADCGYDDYCDLSGGSPGACTPIPNDVTVYCADCPKAVPDQATITSAVSLSDTTHYIDQIYVKVKLLHTYQGQLTLTLSNGDAAVTLHELTGGSADDVFKVYEIADSAHVPGALDGLHDFHPDGIWTLSVTDGAAGDIGSLEYWTIYVINHDLLNNGEICGNEDMCSSDYCGNGFCCNGTGTGDCCAVLANCQNGGVVTYWIDPVCDTAVTCQGHRVEPLCTNSECVATDIADDSACDGALAAPCFDCRPNPVCNADEDQDDPLARCPLTCGNNDDVCQTTCFCDGTIADPNGICVDLLDLGDECAEESDCDVGLHCQNGVCCPDGEVCCTDWSQCPNDVGVVAPGVPYYSDPECGVTPTTCQGTREDKACVNFQCGFSLIEDDTDCGLDIIHSYCGFYPTVTCDATLDQFPACATSCVIDADCDANAHCTAGECIGDYDNGHTCDEDDGAGDNECVSDHCQNGFCCTAGDCCVVDGDCAGLGYDQAPWCFDASTCQGYRKDAVCVTNTCETSPAIDDDSACNLLLGCAPYVYDYCDGTVDQPIAACPTTCVDDTDCITGAHCAMGDDSLMHCYYDKLDCETCTGNWDCVSGNCNGPVGQEVCCAADHDCVPSGNASLCPGPYSSAAACNDPEHCQGTREDATETSCVCGTVTVDDDSACTTAVTATGIECGCFPHPICDGTASQNPVCATTCVLDTECVGGCTCDSACVLKLSNGEICDEDTDCLSEHCAPSGICCDFECDTTCEACTLTWDAMSVAIDGDYDGADDFNALGHRLGTGVGGIYYLLTWDDDYVYAAWEGLNLTNDNVYIAFDIDKDPNPDAGVTSSYGGVSFGGDRKPEYAMVIHQGDNISYSKLDVDGGWTTAQDVCPFPANCWWHSGGWSGNQTSELRIPRDHLLGLDPDVGFAVWMWAGDNFVNNVWSVWPDTNPIGGGVQDAQDAQFMKLGAGQCTKRAYNTDATDECVGDCHACDGLGACMDAVAGSDPDDDCAASVPDSCGLTGQCGVGSCAYWDTLTPCLPASCEADGNGDVTVQILASLCTGTGSCESPGTTECFPHLCITDACKDPCDVNPNCVQDLTPGPGYYCNNRGLNGAATDDCELKLADALYCDEDSDCISGHCVEIGDVGQAGDVGVCCATACNGHCNSCVTGACTSYADFTDPDLDCGGCEVCDGGGVCRPVDPDTDLLGDPKFFCEQNPLPIEDTEWDCGFDGECDGLGECRKWHSGEICHSSECMNCKIEDQPDYCDVDGFCHYMGPGDPCDGGLNCENSILCRTVCSADAHCCGVVTTQLCHADGACDPCDDSAVCPTDGSTCCQSDACGDVKGIQVSVGTLSYYTATEGAADDFSLDGLGVNAPDRVFTFTTGTTPLALSVVVTGTKDGGASVDTLIYLREVDCEAAGIVVASNDDCGGDPTAGSCFSLNVEASKTYYLVIDGKGGPTDKGDITLTATFDYYCGNGVCDPGEVCGVCADCSPCCGDGSCDVIAGENSCVCSTDCDPALGTDNACNDGCCSIWDCNNQCGDDCDMCDDCSFCSAPVGALESVVHLSGDVFTVTGWACDPDHLSTAVNVEIYDEFGGDTLEGTFTANVNRPDLVGAPGNVCGAVVGFSGTITIAEEGAHTIKAFGLNVDVTEAGAWLDNEICQGVCGIKVCGDDGCGVSCGTCVAECVADGDGTYSAMSTVCTLGQCAAYVDCGAAYACDGDQSKEDGDICAAACLDDDDDYCADGYTCEGTACMTKLDNGEACDEDNDCASDNCRKEISSANYYCAAAGRECSDLGGDGYEAGGVEDPWICTATDVSVECAAPTRCDVYYGRFCDNDNVWTLGDGTSYVCAVGEYCAGDLHYANTRCNGAAGASGACDAPGDFAFGCSDETLLGSLHCEAVNWITVGATFCCEDDGAGTGVASDPCAGKHVECVDSRTCLDGADSCQMVAAGTTCDVSGYCIASDPDWCASGKANGELCAGDYECASKHCDPDLAGVDRCHATETSCVQDHTGAETVTGAGFCVTATGWRLCTNAAWGATVNNCVGCESCVAGACQDDDDNCVQSDWDGCIGACYKTRSNSGLCVAGVCGTESIPVAEGFVCDGGSEQAPSAAGYCDANIDCVAAACAASLHYRGCNATGSACLDIGSVAAGTWNAPLGTAIAVTEVMADMDIGNLSCQTVVEFMCDDTDHCSGVDWYDGYTCDGTGVCSIDLIDIGCCAHSDCGSAQYCDTDHSCKDLVLCQKQDMVTGLGAVWQTVTEDLFNECHESGWDDCDGACGKAKSNTGLCSGDGPTCGTDAGTLTAGNVCQAGAEVAPGTAGIYCDMAVTCTVGACTAQTYYRGCSASGSGCVDINKMDAALWNVPSGEVIAETTYKLGSTCVTDSEALCQESGHCEGDLYYDGYTCNGSGTCDLDDQTSGCCKSAACAASEYCLLTTHICTDLPVCTVQQGDNGYTFQTSSQDLWSDCADAGAFDGCIGTCIKTMSNTGLCSGTGMTCGTATDFVAEGKVCDGGTEAAPSEAIRCSGTIDCVDGACSALRYSLGCSGTDTTCSETGKVAATAWNAPLSSVIDTTEYKIGLTCSTVTDYCQLLDHCAGDDWYAGYSCGGDGTCTADMGDQGCCDHSDCGSAEYCSEAGHACTALPLCAKRTVTAFGYTWQTIAEDQRDECDSSGWSGCASACVKIASNTGFCSGTGSACGTATENVILDGKVCAGPGLEVSPSVTAHCDTAIDCVDNACSANRWFQGCAAGTTSCTDTGHVATTIWYTAAGAVIDETATNTGTNLGDVSCSTDASACDDTDHCTGDDWYTGYTCSGIGTCDQSLGDIGCCNHTDCGSAEYCQESNHACTALSKCTKRSSTAFGYVLQSDSEDLGNECTDSDWDGCIGTCQKTKSNTGLCSGTGQDCGTQTDYLTAVGKVCFVGAEVDPSATNACDTTIDCATGACTVAIYQRGCVVGGTTCVDENRQDGPNFYAPIGTVIDETIYQVGASCSTSSTGYCQLDGHCVGDDWYAGYLCDGSGACNVTSGDIGCCENTDCGTQQYCDLGTHLCTALPLCTMQHLTQAYGYENQAQGEDLFGECAIGSWDDCVGACVKMRTSGEFCDGNGTCGADTEFLTTAGMVCDGGNEVAASQAINCTATIDCTTGACAATRFWLGCSTADTSCVETNKVEAASGWNAPVGVVISATEYKVGGACQAADVFCGTTDHCSGDDWYDGYTCDGAGTCTGDKDDLGCCNHSDCGATQFCNEADHQCTVLPLCTKRSGTAFGSVLQTAVEDQRDECDLSGWDGCLDSCTRTASETGFCSGTAAACGTDSTPVGTAGKVCLNGNEVDPSASVSCDLTIDCATTTCSAAMWYRGCDGSGTSCVDTGKVSAGTWYAGSGVVINETATHSEAAIGDLSCITADILCVGTDHCYGNDWFSGFSCDGAGSCSLNKDDIGCCNHTDCASTEYCNASDHTCTALLLCTKRSMTDFGYDWQTTSEDDRNECTPSGYDSCDGTCQKTKSNTGFCSGSAAACGIQIDFLGVAGKVCVGGAEVDPSATAACDSTIDCVDNACVANTYHRGCAVGATSCVDSNRQAGPAWFAANGTVTNATEYLVAVACPTNTTDLCSAAGHCVGKDYFEGYVCNGAGTCNVNQNDIGCCSSVDCPVVEDYCDINSHACEDLPLCTERHATLVYGYQNQEYGIDTWDDCTPGAWDSCESPCAKRATGGDDCDGNGQCIPFEISFVAKEKVCLAGMEVDPSAAAYCDQTIDCVTGACSAPRYFRGCSGISDACINDVLVSAPVWYSGVGNVVNGTTYKVGGACLTSNTAFCNSTNHCSGDDWWDGYTCDAVGGCTGDKTDIGCCLDSDCAEVQYCQLSSHTCTGLTAPTILSVTPLLTFNLNSMLGQVEITWSGTLLPDYEYNLDEVSPSASQAYYGTGTNHTTAVMDDNVLHCYRVRIQDTNVALPDHSSVWSSTVCAFTPDRTPTFGVLAGHSAVTGTSNRIDTSFAAQDSGLVVYMPFEEGSGGVTYDRVSGAAQAISGVAWTTGHEGGALEFDGINNDWVQMPDTGKMGLFTLSAWVYNGAGGDGQHSMVRDFWEIKGTQLCFFSYDFGHDYWRCSDGGSVPDNAWSYVATTWDGSVIRHYVDGELVWADSSTSSGTSQSMYQIGGYASRKMKGKLDELRIYNRTLEQREIRDDMVGGVITHNLFRSSEVNGSWVPKYSAQSCSDLGWGGSYGSTSVCGASSVPGCYPTKTWAQANDICQAAGGRLCTWSELNADEAAGTGCGYDNARVWTSTQCGTSSYWTQAGKTANLGTYPKQCTTAATGVAVRCCADAPPLLSTNSIQDTESWDWNPPAQPNAPVVTVLSDTALGVSWTGPADQGVTYYYYTKTFDNEGNESNFMDHPSFEDATDHSSDSYGAYSFATDAAHTGTYSLKATGGAVEYEMHPTPSLFEQGGTYRLSAWVREDPASTGCNQYLHARWWFAGGSTVTTSGGDVPNDGQWHQTSTTITLPLQGAVTNVAWYLGYDPDCAGSRWMDDVEIVRITSASLTAGTKDFEVDETTSHAGASGYGWGSGTSFNDTGLTGSTQYCYKIRARDQGLSEGAWSATACKTTDSSCFPLTATNGKVGGADSGQVCDGGTVSLTATASGGFCTGQIQYRWYNGGTPLTGWDPDSSYSPVVSSDTTFTVYARCNDCAVPEVSDNVAVTLYECCIDPDHTDCVEGEYCSSHVCTTCTSAQCATVPNCRNGTAGCCDLDSECAALQYCDDGDNSGTRKYACENAISLPRGSSTGAVQISSGTVDDIGWYANFTSTSDACVLYDVYDAENSSQFDIYSMKSKLVDAAGGGNNLWLNYMWYDLGLTSTGNQVVEFDAITCCHNYRNVMLGWIKTETGATGGASTSCCNASTDCVHDYVVNSVLGCYDTNSWLNTGGGHGAELEQCRSGIWYTPDGDTTTCTNGGFTWFTAVSGGSYSPCCGDDAGADDFYHHSAAPATATTVNCRRCLDGAHTYTANLRGNGWSSGTNTICYYGDITCNTTTASHGATCTMTSTSSKCAAGTTAAQGCGVHGLWTGAVNTDWFNVQNWDNWLVPGSGDGVTIPNGKPHYPNITSGIAHAAYIIINSSASVTISGGTLQVHSHHPDYGPEGIRNYGTLTASSGTLTMSAGILNRNATVNFSGATVTLGSHLYNVNGYTSNRVNITGGTVTTASIPNYEGKIVMSGGTLNNNGYYREADSGGGTFEGSGGTVNFGGSSYIRLMHVGSYFNTVNITGARYITDSDRAFKINGHFTIASGKSLDSNSEPMEIRRDWINNGTFIADNGTVTFNGTSYHKKIRGSTVTTFYNLVIDGINAFPGVENGGGNNQGIDINVSNDLTIKKYMEINDKSAGNVTVNVDRDITIASGAFFNVNDGGYWYFVKTGRNWSNAGTYYVCGSTRNYFDSSQLATISGNTSFRDFYVEVPDKEVDFTAGSTQTVTGKFRIAGTSGNEVILRSTGSSQWYLNNSGTNDVEYVDVQRSNADGGNLIDARNGGVDSGNNDNWLFAVGNGHPCTGDDADCVSGNCDKDWYGVWRCHATATKCVNDVSGAQTANGGYWKCVETGDDAEDATTKVCSSGTWVNQTCGGSQYCTSGVCTNCTSVQCPYYLSCRDGVNGICCDADSECAGLKYCDDGDNSGPRPYLCETAISLPRGTKSGSYNTSTVDDIGWYANFATTSDACVLYDVHDAENSSQFDIYASKSKAYDAQGGGNNAWLRYKWYDLSTKLSSTGNQVVEFDAIVAAHTYDNVMLGWKRAEAGATDGSGSTSCCDASSDCVDDYAVNSVWGCYNTSSCRNTGSSASTLWGGEEYCDSGTWRDQDYNSSACSCTDNTCAAYTNKALWSVGGATNCGTECCGDDPGEYKKYKISYPMDDDTSGQSNSWWDTDPNPTLSFMYWVNWASDMNDDGCCEHNNDCVYGSVCYLNNGYRRVKSTGNDQMVRCVNGEWRDLDGAQTYCNGPFGNARWLRPTGTTPGEYGDDALKTNGGIRGTSFECCGDDANEHIWEAGAYCHNSAQTY